MVPVTFLLPVYNGAKYLSETLDSLSQQTFADFEALIINDGSTDNTQFIIDQHLKKDKRFRCISRENWGLVKTLNQGIDEINSEYIARIDADDLCHPQRLELQIKYMSENPHIGLSGSNMEIFGDQNYSTKYPLQDHEIRGLLIFSAPFSHPSIIMRKALLEKHSLRYDENFKDCEDYKLWADLAEFTSLGNLPSNLLRYRKHAESVSSVSTKQQSGSQLIRKIILSKLNFPARSIIFHLDYCSERYNNLELEYWPVYLADLRKLGEAYYNIGYNGFIKFCRHSFPPSHAEKFIECVAEALKAS